MAAQDKVTFKQDLTEPVKIRHYEGVVFTGDDCGNLIKVALFDGGVPYSGGGTVSATAILADGTTFPLTQGSITDNMVSVPLEAGALAVSGLMGLYVKISGDGIICTVLNAIFTVQATDTGMVPAAMVTTVAELVQDIKDAQDSFPADLTNLLAAVAPTFSASTAYSAGAYVWQGGKLYRFTAAHPAGTWTGTDAAEVALGNDVADLKSALNGTEVKTQIQYEYNNAYYDLSGETVNLSVRGSSEFFHCALIPCQKDDKFVINVVGGNASRAYGFVEADNTIIQPVAPAGTTYTNETIVAPTGAAYLILNDRKSGGESYKVKTLADRLDNLEATAIPSGNKIACYGDSLTYGYMASDANHRYPAILSTLADMMAYNYGISGEASDQILARQMGYPAWVNDMTIPAEQTAVEVNWYANSMRSQSKTVKTIIGSNSPISTINPVTIAGVTGNLSYTNGTVYFTRVESGSAVAITRPVPVVVDNALDARNLIQIYWVGTNGGWFVSTDDTQTRINKLLDQIDAMIRYNRTGKYLVLGLTYYYDFVTSTGLTPDQLDYAMQLRYSNNFVNVRRYMMEFGLSDAGITPTQADTTAIAEGKVPPSLLASDGIHGTDDFYSIVAHIVYKRGQELGYWD